MTVKQEAGDNSYNVNAAGQVTITVGLSVADRKEIVRDMLREQMFGIQLEAKQIIESRNEQLMESFLNTAEARFGEKLEENLGRLRDPGAQYALRSAQRDYCRYGDDSSRDDALDLLVERIGANRPRSENIVIDEAIEVVARLSQKQIDLLCFYTIALRFAARHIVDVNAFIDHMKVAALFIDGLSLGESSLNMMASQGVLSQMTGTRHWKDFYEITKAQYWTVLISGVNSQEELGIDPTRAYNQPVLAENASPLSRFIPINLQEAMWRSTLLAVGMSEEEVNKCVSLANEKIVGKDALRAFLEAEGVHLDKAWDSFGASEQPLSNFTPTPVGMCIAYARLKRENFPLPFSISDII